MFIVQTHFAPGVTVPQALHIRKSSHDFWADSRQLGWKFSHCFTGCGGIRATIGKDQELKCHISSYGQSQGIHSSLNPIILFALYYVLQQYVGERKGSKSQKSFCGPFQHLCEPI